MSADPHTALSPRPQSSRLSVVVAVLCTATVILAVLGVRWFGPHDLYEKDQPKTLAYTADIVRHGRFSLPRDVIYQPATKPPMYNWIAAAAVAASGSWAEWTMKLPSVLGVLATGGIVFAMARRAARITIRSTQRQVDDATAEAVDLADAEGRVEAAMSSAGDDPRRPPWRRKSAEPNLDSVADRSTATIVALVAVGIWFTFGSDVRHGSVLRLSYLARPDMLLTAFCTAAWALFTVSIDRPTARAAFVPAVFAWLCVTAAALTKGPAAMLPILFAFVYAVVRVQDRRNVNVVGETDGSPETVDERSRATDRSPLQGTHAPAGVFSRLLRSWWPVGVPILLLGVGGWLYFAAQQDAAHVRSVIWGAEVAGRLTETPEGFRKPWYFTVMWFVTKAQPWGGLALFSLLAVAWLRRLRRPAAPAALYLLIVLIGLSLPAAKRMDYLLPAFAPAAVLVAVLLADLVRGRVLGALGLVLVVASIAATLLGTPQRPATWAAPMLLTVGTAVCLFIEGRRRLPLAVLAVIPLVIGTLQVQAFRTKFFEVQNRWSDRAVAFTQQVRAAVRDDQSLLVIVRGKHPLTTLLGRHQGSYLTPADLAAAEFVVLPQQADLKAEALSEPLPEGFAELENRPLVRLGLYRGVPIDRLIAAQKACGEWTAVENPYHEAGTVYRDQ